MTESWSSTKDSLGNTGVRCCAIFPSVCGDKGDGEDGFACVPRCHADLTEVGEGSCASFSARVILRETGEAAGGNDAAIISYADGERSTRDESN
jgi:hypothetical protein